MNYTHKMGVQRYIHDDDNTHTVGALSDINDNDNIHEIGVLSDINANDIGINVARNSYFVYIIIALTPTLSLCSTEI